MLKRIIILVCLLAAVAQAEYMTDYIHKSLAYGPWLMEERHIYWWTPADTDEVATYCDTVSGPTTITDTAFTNWMRMANNMDAYVCLFKMTEGDTTFGIHSADSLHIDVQTTNDTLSIDYPKSYFGSTVTDTTTAKFYAPADSFRVGSYTWGQYIRIRAIKWINVPADSCLEAIHRTEDQPGRTKLQFWVLPIDTE